MENRLISVIIPTYKRPYSMIEKAINSVLGQTYNNLELIIVDDSPESFDNRKEIEYNISLINDKRIKYIKHKINKGACAARNTGINHSKGEYIAFLDDDDEWLYNKLEEQMCYLDNYSLDMVSCYWIECKDNSERTVKINKEYNGNTEYEKLLNGNYIGSTSFVLIKRLCFDECGLFNESLKSCQDWDMWIRISKKFNIGYVDKPLVKYYIHNSERISTTNNNQLDGQISILDIYKNDLNKYPKALKNQLLNLSLIYFYRRDYKNGVKTFKRAVRIKPSNTKSELRMFMRLLKRMILNLFSNKK